MAVACAIDAVAGNKVITGAAAEDIGPLAADQGIVAGAAIKLVGALAAIQHVVAFAAEQVVLAACALDVIVAGAADDDIGAAAAGDIVVTGAAVDELFSIFAFDNIVVVGADDLVDAGIIGLRVFGRRADKSAARDAQGDADVQRRRIGNRDDFDVNGLCGGGDGIAAIGFGRRRRYRQGEIIAGIRGGRHGQVGKLIGDGEDDVAVRVHDIGNRPRSVAVVGTGRKQCQRGNTGDGDGNLLRTVGVGEVRVDGERNRRVLVTGGPIDHL